MSVARDGRTIIRIFYIMKNGLERIQTNHGRDWSPADDLEKMFKDSRYLLITRGEEARMSFLPERKAAKDWFTTAFLAVEVAIAELPKPRREFFMKKMRSLMARVSAGDGEERLLALALKRLSSAISKEIGG